MKSRSEKEAFILNLLGEKWENLMLIKDDDARVGDLGADCYCYPNSILENAKGKIESLKRVPPSFRKEHDWLLSYLTRGTMEDKILMVFNNYPSEKL